MEDVRRPVAKCCAILAIQMTTSTTKKFVKIAKINARNCHIQTVGPRRQQGHMFGGNIVSQIQREIFARGSVSGVFEVYEVEPCKIKSLAIV